MNLHRAGIYQIDDVMPFVAVGSIPHGSQALPGRPQKIYDGKTVHMDSKRYQTFAQSGLICVACGLEAQYFALERQVNSKNQNRYHFNLYGVSANGVEILFTKDHITPRARGGSNDLSNLQTMCQPCNTAKGHQCAFTDWYAKTRSKLKHQRHRIQQHLKDLKDEKKEITAKVAAASGGIKHLEQQYIPLKKKRQTLISLDVDLQTLDDMLRNLRKAWFAR